MIRKHLMNKWDFKRRRSGIILTLLNTYDLLMGSKLSVSGLFVLTAPPIISWKLCATLIKFNNGLVHTAWEMEGERLGAKVIVYIKRKGRFCVNKPSHPIITYNDNEQYDIGSTLMAVYKAGDYNSQSGCDGGRYWGY